MTADPVADGTRRVHPWIAALLTLLLGWGVGFFYARQTKAAIFWAIVQVVVGVGVAVALFVYMISTETVPPFFNPESLTLVDAASVAISAVVAILAWVMVSRRRHVQHASPLRLFGYLAIWLVPLLASLVLALGIRFFYVQPFRMPSGSMQPTLHVGDYFLVSKTSYGYGPYSTAPFVGIIPHRTSGLAPQRGDLVVFRPVHEPDRDFVKRVVGLPGDRIQMIDGVLHINGAPVQTDSLGVVAFENGEGDVEHIQGYRETLPGGATFTTFDRDPRSPLDNTREVSVPEGRYFVMGDDRDFSDDSRHSVGFVPLDNFVGRVDRIMRSRGDH
jgi:signal peptidase I